MGAVNSETTDAETTDAETTNAELFLALGDITSGMKQFRDALFGRRATTEVVAHSIQGLRRVAQTLKAVEQQFKAPTQGDAQKTSGVNEATHLIATAIEDCFSIVNDQIEYLRDEYDVHGLDDLLA